MKAKNLLILALSAVVLAGCASDKDKPKRVIANPAVVPVGGITGDQNTDIQMVAINHRQDLYPSQITTPVMLPLDAPDANALPRLGTPIAVDNSSDFTLTPSAPMAVTGANTWKITSN